MKTVNKKVLHDMMNAADSYNPFIFQWAHDAFLRQQAMHWLPEEVDFTRDIVDYWNTALPIERDVISRTLLFFTKMDVEIGKIYLDHFIPIFKNLEIRRMLCAFANMEQIHAYAYSLLDEIKKEGDKKLRTINDINNDSEEKEEFKLDDEFLEIKAMSEKFDYMTFITDEINQNGECDYIKLAVAMCVISAGCEGFVLYSSFCILFSFSSRRSECEHSLIKGPCFMGVGQVVEWSIRDESHHAISMIKLCLEFCEAAGIDIIDLTECVHEHFRKLFEFELKVIQYIFKDGDLPYLSSKEVVEYMQYLINIRLKQLGMPILFLNNPKPLKFMLEVLGINERSNFFDTSVTEYNKVCENGNMDDAFQLPSDK